MSKTGAEIIEEYRNQSFATCQLSLEEMIDKEFTALRSQVAELQRQLDEQAKQEPVGAIEPNGRVSIWLSHFEQHPWSERFKPLYALPSNLPAMIEQAVREEREACAKACDELHQNWRFDNDPDSDSGPRSCAAAIRARGEKK